MIQKTNKYEQFKFREDNREKIDQSHVRKLMESIQTRNLLEMRPIIVNKKMEVLDGQHRLLAAQELGLDIYYEIKDDLGGAEIILMNISKSWGMGDYLNYYITNDYAEYKKLKAFMEKYNLSLKVAFNITAGNANEVMNGFKSGDFVFNEDVFGEDLSLCWQTINYIKRMNGACLFVHSVKFWKALIKLVRHADFDQHKWLSNLSKHVEKFVNKAKQTDYEELFSMVHNYHNRNRITLVEKVI
jgi:hypothetical protein